MHFPVLIAYVDGNFPKSHQNRYCKGDCPQSVSKSLRAAPYHLKNDTESAHKCFVVLLVVIIPPLNYYPSFSIRRKRVIKRSLHHRRITWTSVQTAPTRLRTGRLTIFQDHEDDLKNKHGTNGKAICTTEPGGGASEKLGVELLTRALEKYCWFFNVPSQELFHTLKMADIFVCEDLFITDFSYFVRRESDLPCLWSSILVDHSTLLLHGSLLQLKESRICSMEQDVHRYA